VATSAKKSNVSFIRLRNVGAGRGEISESYSEREDVCEGQELNIRNYRGAGC